MTLFGFISESCYKVINPGDSDALGLLLWTEKTGSLLYRYQLPKRILTSQNNLLIPGMIFKPSQRVSIPGAPTVGLAASDFGGSEAAGVSGAAATTGAAGSAGTAGSTAGAGVSSAKAIATRRPIVMRNVNVFMVSLLEMLVDCREFLSGNVFYRTQGLFRIPTGRGREAVV